MLSPQFVVLVKTSEVLRVDFGAPEEGENLYVPEYASQLQQGPFELAGYIYAELSAHRAVLDIGKEQLLDDQDDMTGRPPLLL